MDIPTGQPGERYGKICTFSNNRFVFKHQKIIHYTTYYTKSHHKLHHILYPLPLHQPLALNLRTTSLEDGGFLNGVQFAVRVGILALTMLTFGLVWWYQELERRLLVVRHHLSSNVSLMCSPLMTPFTLELIGKVAYLR